MFDLARLHRRIETTARPGAKVRIAVASGSSTAMARELPRKMELAPDTTKVPIVCVVCVTA
jgi:hypothetical protein